MKRIVIDASVALKWYFSDEEFGDIALGILDDHISERIALHAPALLEFEVANGLAIATRRGRVEADETIKALEGFMELGIELHPLSPHFKKVLEFAEKYKITAYDAAYVALADDLKTTVVTADKRLFEAAGELGCVRWVGEL